LLPLWLWNHHQCMFQMIKPNKQLWAAWKHIRSLFLRSYIIPF
jgi:hypothetical protein